MSHPDDVASSRIASSERLRRTIRDALEQLKANDIVELDVRGKTSVTDRMIIASGTSTRHVAAIADEVQRRARQIDNPPIGVEGEREAEWVLVDLGDAIVHVMLPRVRELYMLERLWGDGGERPRSVATSDAPEASNRD